MDRFKELALAQGIIPPPEGVSWNRHMWNLQQDEREKCIAFLRSLKTVSSPEEDKIREEIRQQLAALPPNPTEEDFERVGMHFVPIEEYEKE